MNAIEALKKAKLLLSQGKSIVCTINGGLDDSFANDAQVITFISSKLVDNPDNQFLVEEQPVEFTQELFAQVWDEVKPASSPAAHENKFFARIVERLVAKGLL